MIRMLIREQKAGRNNYAPLLRIVGVPRYVAVFLRRQWAYRVPKRAHIYTVPHIDRGTRRSAGDLSVSWKLAYFPLIFCR